MKWIISNHKLSFDSNNIENYIDGLNKLEFKNIKLVICPRHEHLKNFSGNNYYLGCQDIIKYEELKKYNIKYSIIGHSDRRINYNETDEQINQKIKYLLSNNITPILCIGEKKGEDIKAVLKRQLELALKDIYGKIIIAYEPVWAIGSGNTPSNETLEEIINFISNEAINILGYRPLILYGGSVNYETVVALNKIPGLDGYLIGNASLKIENLMKLVEVI